MNNNYKIPRASQSRYGNWIEEKILRDEKLQEFLQKVENGQVEFKRKEKRIEFANLPTAISHEFKSGSNIMIRSAFTNGYLVAVLPETFPNISESQEIEVATSIDQDPREGKARSSFNITQYQETDDGQIKWGDKVYISIMLPGLDKPLYLSSDQINPSAHRLNSTQQHVFLTFQQGAKSLWKWEWPNPAYSLEMDQQPVKVGEMGLLVHVTTGTHLSAACDTTFVVQNDFGAENGVACHTYFNRGNRLDQVHNFFCVQTKNS